jgi:nicotinamidase-related amidase
LHALVVRVILHVVICYKRAALQRIGVASGPAGVTRRGEVVRPAVIVIDMLEDFVNGGLRCERAQGILGPLGRLLEGAREAGVPVVYSNDAHLPEIDREFEVWGPHAVAGSPGAEVIPELEPGDADFVVPKRRYSGFYGTDLDALLGELGVDTVVLTGLHTNICVRHTAADAFQGGYSVVVPEDATEAFTQEGHEAGLAYLREVYGAEITDVGALLERMAEETSNSAAGKPVALRTVAAGAAVPSSW